MKNTYYDLGIEKKIEFIRTDQIFLNGEKKKKRQIFIHGGVTV